MFVVQDNLDGAILSEERRKGPGISRGPWRRDPASSAPTNAAGGCAWLLTDETLDMSPGERNEPSARDVTISIGLLD